MGCIKPRRRVARWLPGYFIVLHDLFRLILALQRLHAICVRRPEARLGASSAATPFADLSARWYSHAGSVHLLHRHLS